MAAAQPDDDFGEDDLENTLVPPPVTDRVAARESAAEAGSYVWYDAANWADATSWTRQGEEMTLDDFDKENAILIGQGAFGDIIRTVHKKTGEDVVIKTCLKKKYEEKGIVSWVMNERYALARLNSPYVIKLMGSFQTQRSLCFVMKYMPNSDMRQLMKSCAPFHFLLCRHYAAEIVAGLHYLRESDIIHRDIKPQNILLDNEFHIKIADFGACTTLVPRKNMERTGFDDRHLPTPKNLKTGTMFYMSPEVFNLEEQSFGSDLWSLGCIIFEMYTGLICFNDPTDIQVELTRALLKLIQDAIGANINAGIHTPWPWPPEQVVQDLVNKLLKRDPNQRIGMHPRWRVTELKAHDFFKGINWPKLHLTPPPHPIPPVSEPPPFDESDEDHPENVEVRDCRRNLTPISASVNTCFIFPARSRGRSYSEPMVWNARNP